MRGVTPIDVAGRDLGDRDVVLGDRRRRAVVVEAMDALEGAGPPRVEDDELATLLAVEADVAIGLLDDAVRLTGDHVAVLGDPDVDALSAAA